MSESVTVCGNPDDCDDWLFDSGDPATGVEPAWVCQKCGAVDINKEPPSHDDDIR